MFIPKTVKINEILMKAYHAGPYEDKIDILSTIPELTRVITIEESPFSKKSEKLQTALSNKELKKLKRSVLKRLKASTANGHSSPIDELLLRDIAKVIRNENSSDEIKKLIEKIDFSKVRLIQKDSAVLGGALLMLHVALQRAGLSLNDFNPEQKDILTNGQVDIFPMKETLRRLGLTAHFNLGN